MFYTLENLEEIPNIKEEAKNWNVVIQMIVAARRGISYKDDYRIEGYTLYLQSFIEDDVCFEHEVSQFKNNKILTLTVFVGDKAYPIVMDSNGSFNHGKSKYHQSGVSSCRNDIRDIIEMFKKLLID